MPSTGVTVPTTDVTLPTTQPTIPTTGVTIPTTGATAPTTVPTQPTTQPTERPPLAGRWQMENGSWHYYDSNGEMVIGFAQINDGKYYFAEDGAMHAGWLELEGERYFFSPGGVMQFGWINVAGVRYYMDDDGAMHTGWLQYGQDTYYLHTDGTVHAGWLELEEKRYFLSPEGVMQTGWIDVAGVRYYMDEEGIMYTGWLQQEKDTYYLNTDGSLHIGWMTVESDRYYFKEDGVMAKGMVEIEGKKSYFTSTGAYILLVNPWNYVPEDYDPQLVSIQRFTAYTNMYISSVCYDAVIEMMVDCYNRCGRPLIVSTYRTQEFQAANFENKVMYYVNLGVDRDIAETMAATVVARPGTSEHQLGLALDIVDYNSRELEETQANTKVQKWLMEHCWEYGFILRYPKGTTDVTGIIYEPWHYRYVGKAVAKEIYDSGLTLEEYLQQLTDGTYQPPVETEE